MGKWNEQAAANNNLRAETIRTSNIVGDNHAASHEFSEELSDGGERDEAIKKQLKRRQPGLG
ncbi:hypothetical protein [Bacillus sp. T33-2]|uniref:hypothetical protein n=1 Tax=Bacillus sp. T33-2 TaxID=2054168 RepID=UPI000C7860C1|nr:hypothetical protein [Bacillus sp. T33-2]PLR99696.1 hypothetical protein CVD19_01145 [Bacillus sp. T33-2]